MSVSNSAPPSDAVERFGGYELVAPLGEGGMAQVFRARHRDGRELALKRMRMPERPCDQQRMAALFEREYHTLAELAHPRVIEVHDYGVHGETPYYTMELLDGADLRERAPVPWREACLLLRDVASSLSLLHSRRLVHRDLSPRNVRCTGEGRAKLLDFGGLAPMGGGQHVMGTPAYVAPELLHGQPLDGRADLFGLGALAYWTLTGRNAFRARDLRDLADAWRSRPAPPSRHVHDIPRELDALVMQLLDLDPGGRPRSASEVIARLNAIAELALDGALEVAQAYLVAPRLIGRDTQQAEFRRHALAAVSGRGGSVLVEGAARCGRTRLLQTFVIEAKLAGMAVLWASREEAGASDLALLSALTRAAIELMPEHALRVARPHAALLSPMLPELGLATSDGDAIEPGDPRYSEAVARWLLELARTRPLAIVVDDLDRCDLPSAAVIARLAAQARSAPLLLAASSGGDANSRARRAIEQLQPHSVAMALEPLDEAQAAVLLGSIFGAVPNLAQAARWAHHLGEGRPGAIMALAQHLSDSGVAHFAEGGWSLPERLEDLALPDSFDRMLALRAQALSADAHRLAQLLSLLRPHTGISLPECLALLDGTCEPRSAHAAVDELVRIEALAASASHYSIRDPALLEVVRRSMNGRTRDLTHRALAEHYLRKDGNHLEVAYHLFEAGDRGGAVQITLDFIAGELDFGGQDTVFGRTKTGISLIERVYAHARTQGWPPGRIYPLQKILLQLAAAHDARLVRYADHALEQLKLDSGWVYWREYPELPTLERMAKCYARAEAAYEAVDERERGLHPLQAIKELASTAAALNGAGARSADTRYSFELPLLLEPFVELAPVVGLLRDICVQARNTIARNVRGIELRESNLARVQQPVAGMDELTRRGALNILSYYHGLEISMGCDARALELADTLEDTPSYVPLAWQVRMIYHIACGDPEETARCRRNRDLAALQRVESDQHLVRALGNELMLALRCSDLFAVKRLLPLLERESEDFEAWKVWLAYGRACYAFVRDDAEGARQICEDGLAAMAPTGHVVRSHLEGLLVCALLRCGHAQRARELALALDARVEGDHRDPVPAEVALALSQAATGDPTGGIERLEDFIERRRAEGDHGVTLAYLHEQQAWIALEMGDAPALERALAAMAQYLGRDPSLRAKLDHLLDLSQQRGLSSTDAHAHAEPDPVTVEAGADATSHTVVTMLAGGGAKARRAERILALILQRAGACGGYLFTLEQGQPVLMAGEGLDGPDEALLQAVQARVPVECHSETTTYTDPMPEEGTTRNETTQSTAHTDTDTDTDTASIELDGIRLHTFLLTRGAALDAPVGALVLACRAGRLPLVRHETLVTLGAGLAALRDA